MKKKIYCHPVCEDDYLLEYWSLDDPNRYIYYGTDDPDEAEKVCEQLISEGYICGYIRENGESVEWCASREALEEAIGEL